MLKVMFLITATSVLFISNDTKPDVGDTFRDCEGCPEMAALPCGEFMMGSPEDEWNRDADESPMHNVSIDYRLAVGRFEVTVAEFKQFVAETNYQVDAGCIVWTKRGYYEQEDKSWRSPGFDQLPNEPVTCVNWHDAKAYTAWLTKKAGHVYRLLHEAEWEYAVRAGTTTQYYTGTTISPEHANYNANFKYVHADAGDGPFRERTTPVGTFPANGFGLYDMVGNVAEWLEDCYHSSYVGAPDNGDSWQNATNDKCEFRLSKGGAWGYKPEGLRSANRHNDIAGTRSCLNGFRVARVLN